MTRSRIVERKPSSARLSRGKLRPRASRIEDAGFGRAGRLVVFVFASPPAFRNIATTVCISVAERIVESRLASFGLSIDIRAAVEQRLYDFR